MNEWFLFQSASIRILTSDALYRKFKGVGI